MGQRAVSDAADGGGLRLRVRVTDRSLRESSSGGHPALMRMWGKRQRGYRAMGYRIDAVPDSYESLL